MNDTPVKPALFLKTVKRLWSFVPRGGSLPEDVWRGRHRFLVGLTWFHAIMIAFAGPILGYSWELSLGALLRGETVIHTIGEGLVVAAFALLAGWTGGSRGLQATAVGFGLMSSSAILVHLSGGTIELHFHFFVMLVFLALYQDWLPYTLSVVYVAVHHSVVGLLWPEEVYNHAAAFAAPWTWAGIHAFFVLWASVGSMVAWRFNETAFARTKLILDSAGEGIYGLDREGNVTFINPAAAKTLRLDEKHIVGKKMHESVRHTNGDGISFSDNAAPLLATLGDGTARRGTDEMFWRTDGIGIPVDYTSTPIIERGEVTGAVIAFSDVTERKLAEQALAEKAALARSNAELEQFAYVASHDLKEPLRMVTTYTQLLARRYKGNLDADADEFIGYIVHGAVRMHGLIEALLTYSHLGMEAQPSEPTDCAGVLNEALENLSVSIKESGALVTYDPLPTVMADKLQMVQLFQNLIDNAIKFHGAEKPRIHISGTRSGENWLFTVRDNGIGIAPQHHERIFFVFQRLHARSEYPGTGIGLALCKKIVERHRGRIWVESWAGKGATFYFTLPA
jgi:PAS domain S-box-containing protein